jgi:hypothetical protein
MPIREQNEQEREQLVGWLNGFYGKGEESLNRELVGRATIAVRDDYATDSPVYSGKIIMVMWPGSPTFFNVFTIDDRGALHEERQEG